MNKEDNIYISGHRGMVGSAIHRLFIKEGYENIITAGREEVDLVDQSAVKKFFQGHQIDSVIIAAAKVGGINANMNFPAQFFYDNLMIQNNLINESYLNGVKKVVFLGSSCIYPKECEQPMKEEYLLTGKLEPTNESYALAKIAGLRMVDAYKQEYGLDGLSLMPCNLYGPNDSFDLENSHVLSAFVKRFSDAKDNNDSSVTLWGSGIARREFMHVDDMAKATLFAINNFSESGFINVGWGKDISIKELAELTSEKVAFKGTILWDTSKPDGMLRKCLDVTKMKKLGFEPTITLSEGIDHMIAIYKELKTKE